MKTNVTLKLDVDPLCEARLLAAEEGRSITALLAERLEAVVRERRRFDGRSTALSRSCGTDSTRSGHPRDATSSMNRAYRGHNFSALEAIAELKTRRSGHDDVHTCMAQSSV